MTQRIIKGQGPIFMGDYDDATGRLKNVVKIGCGNRALVLSMARETEKIKESCTGQALDLAEFETSKTLTVRLEMQQFDEDMLAFGLYGTAAAVTGASVTNETMPTVAVGDYYHTKHAKISAVTVKDSAGTPATLVLDTDYAIDSADYGRIHILALGSYTQPLKIDYTHASRTNIKPFSVTGAVKGLIFEGVSSVDGSKMRVLIPRISFAPTTEFQLVGDSVVSLALEGPALVADVSANDPILGAFGNLELL